MTGATLGVAVVLAVSQRGDSIAGTPWTQSDWRIFEAKIRWAQARHLDRLPVGKRIVALATSFVGTPYRPATLEVPGPERLVVNLRELDCVTLVENVLALARFVAHDGVAALGDPAQARARYQSYLQDLRYRDGATAGYPSRLHYFSDWLGDNERRGAVHLIARSLGGVVDSEPIGFMSAHRAAYRQLADSGVWAAIRSIEERLNMAGGRWYLPKAKIAAAAGRIQDGDLIAATSTRAGLDVAHTGFALWRGGKLHLVHAPLVGKAVEISPLPLAARIARIPDQDGIMVARPVERRLTTP